MENDIAGAKIERVGEGIKITFDSGILFETNSSTLQSRSQNKYFQTCCTFLINTRIQIFW